MNFQYLWLKYIKRKKPNKITRICLGDPQCKFPINDNLTLTLKDIIILTDVVGIGISEGWIIDLRKILFDTVRHMKNMNYNMDNLPQTLCSLINNYIIEEVSHHLGELHQNDNEDWCYFFLIQL